MSKNDDKKIKASSAYYSLQNSLALTSPVTPNSSRYTLLKKLIENMSSVENPHTDRRCAFLKIRITRLTEMSAK
jgi:hypothetical protein